jgi:hypothetical protein
MIAAEATEVPLVSPVQDKGFHMTHDACERWLIMIEQDQQVIVQLQDEPYLIGIMGSPTGNPDEIQAGPSNPKLLYIDEIVELDDPEIPTPQARSLGDVLVQSETVEKSGRESAPNPLNELINIYDGEESLEVSLVTPVPIMEEKDPEKESTPAPDAQIHGLPQNEQEVESVLDTELPNAPDTQVDSPKDELGSGEQKEEAPWKEIDISTTDYQVSTKC